MAEGGPRAAAGPKEPQGSPSASSGQASPNAGSPSSAGGSPIKPANGAAPDGQRQYYIDQTGTVVHGGAPSQAPSLPQGFTGQPPTVSFCTTLSFSSVPGPLQSAPFAPKPSRADTPRVSGGCGHGRVGRSPHDRRDAGGSNRPGHGGGVFLQPRKRSAETLNPGVCVSTGAWMQHMVRSTPPSLLPTLA